jgi:hypothetical protein
LLEKGSGPFTATSFLKQPAASGLTLCASLIQEARQPYTAAPGRSVSGHFLYPREMLRALQVMRY